MALQVVSPSVSVYKVLGVKDGQEQTEEHTFQRGEILPDWVNTYQQFVLTQTGMARQVGDFPDPALRAATQQPAPVLLPEHDPRTVLGTNVTQPALVTKRVTGEEEPPTRSSGEEPSETDNKPVWEDYAVESLGMKRTEAESLKKADLVKEVRRRQAAKSSNEDDAALPRTFAPQGQVAQPGGASSRAGGDASLGENAAKGGTPDKAAR
jgi:hypothetical protein